MILIEQIIKTAIEKDASDVHLMFGLRPIIRIDRALVEMKDIAPIEEPDLYDIYEYVIKGNVEKDEVYRSGRRLDSSIIYEGIRLRVNASFSDDKPIFTMRIIKNDLPKFEELGVPDIVKAAIHQPQGVILITGKTNSGKTTTLNALIDDINTKQNKKILTLESPIEYKHTSKKSIIVQKEVGIGKDCLNYSEGVKNALREDCDILVVRRDTR